jgi:hypothetical protein
LRLYGLGRQSLWYDEAVSAFLAARPVIDLVARTARDIHPPGYYLLLHFWVGLVGQSAFALAFFSLIFGTLLMPLTYRLARRLTNPAAAWWGALLVVVSPYHIWYAQEVRMYTLGATLGLLAAYALLRANRRRWWLVYIGAAVGGLYTLYYFAFLLLVLKLLWLAGANRSRWRSLLAANGLVMAAYLPWLPTLWRQATNPPVPSWREAVGLGPMLLESWSALSLGQSVEPTTVWPILLLTLLLFGVGLGSLGWAKGLFLAGYTFGPLLLIYLASLLTPLYHVRYLFIYAPAFYIVVGSGLAARPRLGVVAAGLLLAASFFSLAQFHTYRTDDYRAAVHFIEEQWQPGDAILLNAGYIYPAYLYYTRFAEIERRRLVPPYQPPSRPLLLEAGTVDGSPQLGWGDPRADFYAMSTAETVAALESVAGGFPRLWVLRAYDTVTDPDALIRDWLAQHAVLIEDQPFPGESNIRAQGFLFLAATSPFSKAVYFADGMALAGWELPARPWRGGETVHLKLWWQAEAPPDADYKMSLKLWSPDGALAAQGEDRWPGGSLFRPTAWPPSQVVYQPAAITLPPNLLPGEYWLNVELYHPETIQPLPRLDGGDPVVTLGAVWVADQ